MVYNFIPSRIGIISSRILKFSLPVVSEIDACPETIMDRKEKRNGRAHFINSSSGFTMNAFILFITQNADFMTIT
jgi:hypothetical protein